MSTFTIQFNTVEGVTRDLHESFTSLNGYKGSLESVTASLNRNMGARYYASFKRRLDAAGADLEEAAKISYGMEEALRQIVGRYLQTERKLSPSVSGGTKTPYGTIPEDFDNRIRKVVEELMKLLQRIFSPDGCTDRKDVIKRLLMFLNAMSLMTGNKCSADSGNTSGGEGTGSEEDFLKRLSDMFDLPGDIHDAISSVYDVFDKEGYDESGIAGFIFDVLGVMSGGADLADSKTNSELYRNAVDFGKDFLGGTKGFLSMLKHADIIPDNHFTAGLLFGLKEFKHAAGFTVDFLENFEKNKDNWAGFLRDSGKMAEDISKFIQGAVTSKDGFLKGLKGKALIAAQMWGTTVTSLYTAGSYAIGDMIEKAKNGTLDWGSGAESWGKGAVGGMGKIHKFLTLGLVDPDMDKTWSIYQKYMDRNAERVNKYGKNWFTRGGIVIYGTLESFVGGTAESIWSSSYDAAGKIVNGFQTAGEVVSDVGSWLWSKGSDLVSSFW